MASTHFEHIQDLVERFQLTPDDVRIPDNYALRWASENGHLEVLSGYIRHDFNDLTYQEAISAMSDEEDYDA
jgi:hypothetical protein